MLRPPTGAATVLFVASLVVGMALAPVVWPPGRPLAAPPSVTAAAALPAVAAEPTPEPATGPRCRPASLAARAGQVLVVGLPATYSAGDPLAREVLDVGVGGVFLSDANLTDAAQVRALADGLRKRSELDLIVATDEEAGRVSSFRSLLGVTSSPRTLASTRAPGHVRSFAEETGDSLRRMGITVNFAPVADIDGGPSTGVIGDRSFSADPGTATTYATAFANGLVDAGVAPAAKHFPGHGRAVEDVHERPAVVNAPMRQLVATDVQPFLTLIEDGVPLVMTSHVRYTALDDRLPASLSPTSYALLRELGFRGLAITDSLGMGAIGRRWDHAEAAVMAVAAGADAVLATDGHQARRMRRAIVAAVRSGDLAEARLDEAVSRVLALKGVDAEPVTCMATPPLPAMARRAAGRH